MDYGRTEPQPRGGPKRRRLTNPMIGAVVAHVAAEPTATLKSMQSHLVQQFPDQPVVSLSAISRALDGQLVTLKLLRQDPSGMEQPREQGGPSHACAMDAG